MTDDGRGLSNECAVPTNNAFDEILQVSAWPDVILLRLHRVNCGHQNGASFDYLIETGM